MKTLIVNLNNRVRFKLTPKGLEYLAKLQSDGQAQWLKPDKNGWCEDQLWQFSNWFGPTFYCGMDTAVETEIQILH